MDKSGDWVTGFILPRRFPLEPEWWNTLPLEGRPVLMVADYTNRNSILDRLLNREHKHWRETMKPMEIPQYLFGAIEAAVVRVSEVGGLFHLPAAAETLQGLAEFQGLSLATAAAVTGLLREIYPDADKGIAPLRPDPLFDHLANHTASSR